MRIAVDLGNVNRVKLNKSTNVSPKEYEADVVKGNEGKFKTRNGISSKMSDALALAKVSQQLVNEALTISSQLQNMASFVANGGEVDYEEISPLLAGISSDTGDGKSFTIPVENILIPEFAKSIPDSSENIKIIEKQANQLIEGEIPGEVDFEKNRENLLEKSEKIDLTVKNIESSIINESGVKKFGEVKDSVKSVSDMAQEIVGTSSVALSAQGNIPSEYVAQLLG